MEDELLRRLQTLVAGSGRSPRDISLKAHLSAEAVGRIMNGGTPSPGIETMRKIADQLGVDVAYLTDVHADRAGRVAYGPGAAADGAPLTYADLPGLIAHLQAIDQSSVGLLRALAVGNNSAKERLEELDREAVAVRRRIEEVLGGGPSDDRDDARPRKSA